MEKPGTLNILTCSVVKFWFKPKNMSCKLGFCSSSSFVFIEKKTFKIPWKYIFDVLY